MIIGCHSQAYAIYNDGVTDEAAAGSSSIPPHLTAAHSTFPPGLLSSDYHSPSPELQAAIAAAAGIGCVTSNRVEVLDDEDDVAAGNDSVHGIDPYGCCSSDSHDHDHDHDDVSLWHNNDALRQSGTRSTNASSNSQQHQQHMQQPAMNIWQGGNNGRSNQSTGSRLSYSSNRHGSNQMASFHQETPWFQQLKRRRASSTATATATAASQQPSMSGFRESLPAAVVTHHRAQQLIPTDKTPRGGFQSGLQLLLGDQEQQQQHHHGHNSGIHDSP